MFIFCTNLMGLDQDLCSKENIFVRKCYNFSFGLQSFGYWSLLQQAKKPIQGKVQFDCLQIGLLWSV